MAVTDDVEVAEAEADTDVDVEVMREPMLMALICPSCMALPVSRTK